MTMFLQPTQPRDGQPPIHPPEPPVDLTPLLRRLTLLEAQGRDFSRRITELEATDEFLPLALEVQRLAEAVKVLQNGLAALVDTKTPPPTRCVVTIFGTRINCRLE